MGRTRKIYCIACEKKVEARLTSGEEIYPYKRDLHVIPYWKCDTCKNYVGCHYKSYDPTEPLGCIPTPEIRKARLDIHKIIDPLWQSKRISRKKFYRLISKEFGKKYHTGCLRSMEEIALIKEIIIKIKLEHNI